MSIWWYALGEQQCGPIDESEMKQRLQRNEVSVDTLVWAEELKAWTPLREVQSLQHLLAALPPPLPIAYPPQAVPETTQPVPDAAPFAFPADGADQAVPPEEPTARPKGDEYPLATKWPRFLARTFDIWLFTPFVLLFGMMLVLWLDPDGAIFRSPDLRVAGFSLYWAAYILPLALVLVVDAVVYRLFGNTPGKALLGLRVVRTDGERLSMVQYLGRNVGVWMSGLALGLPLASLASVLYQGSKVERTGLTSYDDGSAYRVRQFPAGFVKKGTFTVLFLAILALNAAWMERMQAAKRALEQQAADAAGASSSSASQVARSDSVPRTSSGGGIATAAKRGCVGLFVGDEMPVIRNPNLEAHTTLLCHKGFATMYSGVTKSGLWSAKHIEPSDVPSLAAMPKDMTLLVDDRIPLAYRNKAADLHTPGFAVLLLTSPFDLDTDSERIQSVSYANVILVALPGASQAFMDVQERARRLAREQGGAYIITGALFEGESLRKTNDGMLIPTAYYLAAYLPGAPSAMAYVVDNDELGKVSTISLAELERRTGINLFPAVSDEIKRAVTH